MQTNESMGFAVSGHIKIHDPTTGYVYHNKRNAVHYENISIALANSIANSNSGIIKSMVFGNGGTSVDDTGIITYKSTNTSGSGSELYSKTYEKVVDANSIDNTNPTRNFIETRHLTGTNYSDLLITCFLDYSEPAGQSAFDSSTSANNNTFLFDELGLKSSDGTLLTHVIFHPVLKTLNRVIQIDYTLRIMSLSGGTV